MPCEETVDPARACETPCREGSDTTCKDWKLPFNTVVHKAPRKEVTIIPHPSSATSVSSILTPLEQGSN